MSAPRWFQGSLYRKYAVYFLVLISAALLASGATGLYFSYKELRTAVVALQQEKARAAAARIETLIRDIERQIRWIRLPPGHGGEVLARRRAEFEKLLRHLPSVFAVSWLDGSGHEQLKVSRLAMDRFRGGADLSATPYFRVSGSEQTYFGPVYFHKESEPFLKIAVADEHAGADVTVAEVNLKFVSDVVSRIRVGATGYAYVVDAYGELVSHPNISLVLQRTDLSKLPQVRAALAPHASGAEEGEPVDAINHAGERVLAAHALIAPLGWSVFVEQPLAEAFAPLYALIARMIFLFVLGLVAAAVASLLLARHMVMPIQVLQAGAARIGAGTLDQRIEVNTGDELQALAAEFDRMAARLRESYAHLEQKVTERTRELATANRTISRFLASASHDLRQPMHALGLYAAALRDMPLPADARRISGQIAKSVFLLQDLMDALLDISKLDAGAVQSNLTDVSMNSLLVKMETHYASAARAKDIEFRIVKSRAWARSDPLLLERILLNLVSNAVHYTRHGKILLGCRRRGGDLRIEVWDTGVGVAADQQRLIFDEFHQVAGAERRQEKGFGLGLAIVERLARLLNHSIDLQSQLGKGSVFAITVPRTAGKDAEADTPPLPRSETSLKGARIVVADDDAMALRTLLESWGCAVSSAVSENEILTLCAATPRRLPDIVICDYRLFMGGTGLSIIQRVRSASSKDIQFILVTADASAEVARHAQESGLPLLHKPVRPAKLRAVLDHCLRSRVPRKRRG